MKDLVNHSCAEWAVREVRTAPGGGVWSFSVKAGEVMYIRDEGGGGKASWLDWLAGVESPPEGQVFWKGVEWSRRAPGDAAAERGRMGCLPAGGGLLANLNMDENVWLPARMHGWEGAAERIERWAKRLGCWPLPAVRAPQVEASVRRRVLWTRLFAGAPEGLVLERPLEGATGEERKLFLGAVDELRRGGVPVVWLEGELSADVREALGPLECCEGV